LPLIGPTTIKAQISGTSTFGLWIGRGTLGTITSRDR